MYRAIIRCQGEAHTAVLDAAIMSAPEAKCEAFRTALSEWVVANHGDVPGNVLIGTLAWLLSDVVSEMTEDISAATLRQMRPVIQPEP